ncbi:MAG: AGE family epimerase/isomerase [Lentisphaeria bacterium]
MTKEYIAELHKIYLEGATNDIAPFWLKHGIDQEFGGIMTSVDADGSLLDSDKGGWQQGRSAWFYGSLYNDVEKRPEWLAAAKNIIDFTLANFFDKEDGRMWYHVTRDGQPIRKRRYSFTEAFFCIALGEYYKATGEDFYREKCIEIFNKYQAYLKGGPKPPKFENTRPSRGMGVPMIDIVVCQELRDSINLPGANERIDECLHEIETYFVKDDIKCVMECVAPDGSIIDTFDGRMLNPGHAIEGAWFIMNEGKFRGNDNLIKLGTKMLDWMWERGWDKEFGGIIYYRDVYNKPCNEYWQDMKFWWPQNETIIATLLAYQLTGDEKYAQMHKMIHDWTYSLFPDKENGEWFGYFHRDRRLSTPIKGSLFKGPFHIPRMMLECAKITGEMLAK